MLYLLKIEKNADMDLCIWYNEKGLTGEIETKGMRNMDKYTVLLVDDEEEVIQVIMKKIDWGELGLSVIGYASNGVKALELVEEFQPDIVMTDIKMPYMDGMELSQQIKREFPATKILIFTGFDEFEYAKEAVHLEVEEYILKPVNAAELKEVFIQVKNKLDQEISEKRSVEVLQRYYMESLPVLRANFYSTLIEGRIQENELPKYLQDYQIAFAGPLFCCLVIHTSSRQVPEGMNPLLLDTSVRKQAEERLGEKWRAKSFSYLGNTVMIVQFEEEWQVADLTDECDRFCRYARRMIGAVVTVGVGKVCRDVLELAKSYIGAREAVSYRAIYGASRAVNIREIDPQETAGGNPTDDTKLGELFKRICLGSEQEVREAADRYLAKNSFPAQSLQGHQIAIMELVSGLYRFSANHDISMEAFGKRVDDLYRTFLDLEPEALRERLIDICLSLHEQMIRARSMSTQSFVTKAKEYVQTHYFEAELSLDTVCRELGVSNSYFSTVFKKEVGKSFIGYLTEYRMEQALRLLLETNDKSYTIAKSVGYTDPNYFSYVFKRQFGVSPSKYRTEYAGSER